MRERRVRGCHPGGSVHLDQWCNQKAIRGQSSDAINGNQRQSERKIRGNRWQSVAISGNQWRQLRGNQWQSVVGQQRLGVVKRRQSDAIRDHQLQSDAIRCHQCQSVASSGNKWQSVAAMRGNQWQSVVGQQRLLAWSNEGSQRQSETIRCNQMQSDAISGDQWQSVVIRCNQRQSVVGPQRLGGVNHWRQSASIKGNRM